MAWVVDPVHSQVIFAVRHMMVTTVKGQFKVISGTVNIDETNPANSWVEAQADVASIDTREANRDGHLRSPDFFDAENHPTIIFKSTKVEHVSGSDYKVTGDLTIRGVTKSAVFNVEYAGQGKDAYGGQRAGIAATTKINRKDWGLTWNAVLETGGVAVSEEVKIEIDLSLVPQPVAAAAN